MAGLAALLGGLGVIVATSGDPGDGRVVAPDTTDTGPSPVAPAEPRPQSVWVALTGTGAYDPDGDGSENDGDAVLATDGNRTTAWKSEHYRRTFTKAGVGLVVDAGRPVNVKQVIVVTEGPGYKAQVRVGASARGPFVTVSETKLTTPRTTFVLQPRSGRYVMLWITSMPETGTAAVNEITATVAG